MPGSAPPPPELDARDLKIAVCASRFNPEITGALTLGAIEAIEKAKGTVQGPHFVAGAFELPVIAAALIESGADAVVAIGCVIRGETPHFDLIAGESARGLMQVMLDTGVPIGNGIITTEDRDQAEARAGGELGNKGAEAAEAAIEACMLLRGLGI
ncbi:MAG: 6,7-dimethyl-8-ribityllumazine synthase [Actinomycetota bacterium]